MIANSILNLKEKGLITSPEEDPHIVEQLGEAGRTLRESEVEPDGGGGGDGGKEPMVESMEEEKTGVEAVQIEGESEEVEGGERFGVRRKG